MAKETTECQVVFGGLVAGVSPLQTGVAAEQKPVQWVEHERW